VRERRGRGQPFGASRPEEGRGQGSSGRTTSTTLRSTPPAETVGMLENSLCSTEASSCFLRSSSDDERPDSRVWAFDIACDRGAGWLRSSGFGA
jgi:hypothetical protein